MNVKSINGEPGERRPGFALLAHSAHPLNGHWSVSDLVALTKLRVIMLAVFTAIVGLSIAPSRLDPLTTFAAVLAIAAGAGACDRADESPDAALKRSWQRVLNNDIKNRDARYALPSHRS